ncbi:hypothetical protein [Sphingomonas sp. Leaf17]|uniref:hypothetical protein n=1 Tax=Sphingomonas sp. Leaf17 TaxID=1735683 RepID=UPI0012E26393|nr:hypothetical protein [Sphingomonas sp. Leaf17]
MKTLPRFQVVVETGNHIHPTKSDRTVVMVKLRLTPTLVGFAGLIMAATGPAARPVSPQQGAPSSVPVAPPPIYDPMPGPFLAIVDSAGKPMDPGVMANAVESWSGPKLAIFLLCFQPARGASARAIGWNALDNVSRVLKAKGAATVLVLSGGACATPPSISVAGKPHVEILGVVRWQE